MDKLDENFGLRTRWSGLLAKESAPMIFEAVAKWLTLYPSYTWITTNRGLIHAEVKPHTHAFQIDLHLDDDQPWMQVHQEDIYWSLHAKFTYQEIRELKSEKQLIRVSWNDGVMNITQYAPAGHFMQWIVVPGFPDLNPPYTPTVIKKEEKKLLLL